MNFNYNAQPHNIPTDYFNYIFQHFPNVIITGISIWNSEPITKPHLNPTHISILNTNINHHHELQKYPNAKHIILDHCHLYTDFKLSSSIISLLLRQCRNLTNLTINTTIKIISLHTCYDLKSLSFISNLPNLKALTLQHCSNLIDINALQTCPSLRHLTMTGCNTFLNFTPIATLNLKSITITNQMCATNLYHLSNPHKLKHVNLNTSHSLNASILSNYNLFSICLANCFALSSLDLDLSSSKSLQVIDLSNCVNITTLIFLQNCPNLTTIDLTNCENITNLIGLNNKLRKVTLTRCKNITDINTLSTSTNLTSLNCSGCHSLSNINPLTKCTNLTALNLSDCPIQDINALTFCPIRSLILSRCHKLTHINSLPNLRILDLSYCHNLYTHISSQFPNLQHIDLYQCNSELQMQMRPKVGQINPYLLF